MYLHLWRGVKPIIGIEAPMAFEARQGGPARPLGNFRSQRRGGISVVVFPYPTDRVGENTTTAWSSLIKASSVFNLKVASVPLSALWMRFTHLFKGVIILRLPSGIIQAVCASVNSVDLRAASDSRHLRQNNFFHQHGSRSAHRASGDR